VPGLGGENEVSRRKRIRDALSFECVDHFVPYLRLAVASEYGGVLLGGQDCDNVGRRDACD